MAFFDSDGLKRVLTKLLAKFNAESSARSSADTLLGNRLNTVENNTTWSNASGTSEGA